MAPNAQKFYPVFDKETPPAMQGHLLDAFTALNDHDAAIVALKEQLDAAKLATNAAIENVTNVTQSTITIEGLAGLGVLNNQTGATAYALQQTDAGALVWFDDPAAIALSLNSTVATPFFTFVFNKGAGVITQTPTTGTLTGLATIAQNVLAIIAFDGLNWWTTAIPAGGGSTPNFADAEIPTGLIDGVNVTYTLAHSPSPAASLILELQGLIQWQDVTGDYTLSGATITFTSAPILGPLVAWYRY